MYGAATATVLSEFCVFCACLFYLRKFTGLGWLGRSLLTFIPGSIIMWMLWKYFGQLNLGALSLSCSIVYFVGMLGLKKSLGFRV
jgi:Polysaccharide biosynthesis C-terminal domain